MADNRSPYSLVALLGLLLVSVTLGWGMIVPRLVHQSGPASSVSGELPVYRQISPFSLTNHLGSQVSLSTYADKIWVAQIIFTRCPGPCPRMTQFFAGLQAKLPQDGSVQLATLTTDPGFDTPEVLRGYASRHGARPELWNFLTGPKSEIIRLAVDGMGLTALDKEESQKERADDLFIHSTIAVVIDQKGRVRGTVETLDEDASARLLDLIRTLQHPTAARGASAR